MMSLEKIWEALAALPERPVFRRVDESHPLDIYVALSAAGARELLLLTDAEPPVDNRHPQGLRLELGRRTDGRWALAIQLAYPELGRLFAHLCEDLVTAARTGCGPADGGRFVIDRIARWERLLSRAPAPGLDESSWRGLLGELQVLRHSVLPHAGPDVAIEAWVGPLKADQDFRLADCLIEVKALSPGSLTVKISSAEQLDAHGIPLCLAGVPLSAEVASGGGNTTLLEVVESVRQSMQSHPGALITFEERLKIAGFTDTDPLARRAVRLGAPQFWVVRSDFPRIIRSALPAAIRSARYNLDLSLCSDFRAQNPFGVPTHGA